MRRTRSPLFLIAPLFVGLSVHKADVGAEAVFKCTDDTGAVVYQQEPCADTQKGEKKDIDPNKNMVDGYPLPPPDSSAAEKPRLPTSPAPGNRRWRGGY